MAVIHSLGYDIFINEVGSLARFLEELSPSKIFVLVDEHTEQNCLVYILEDLPADAVIIQIDSGEINKTIDTATFIWKSLLYHGADRQAVIINLGGGVIGDLGGFCAATFMRGIRFIQVPTSLLAQVDASVGGKLGIDLDHHKNIVGVFRQPEAVFIFTSFIKSVPYRQLQSGYAEILKHHLIADKKEWLKWKDIQQLSDLPYEVLVEHSIRIKNEVVMQDPEERGLRKILNFGHTIGHAIEGLLLDSGKSITHGDAVAIGMVCETHLAMQLGFVSMQEAKEVREHVLRLFGHKYKSMPDAAAIIEAMRFDKKNDKGIIRFSLLEGIGKCGYNHTTSDDQIRRSLIWYIKGE